MMFGLLRAPFVPPSLGCIIQTVICHREREGERGREMECVRWRKVKGNERYMLCVLLV